MGKVEPWAIRAIPESAWFWDRSLGSSLGATFKMSALYWFHECLVIQLETLWLYLSIRLRKLCLRRYPMKFSLVGTFKVQPSQLIDRRKTDQQQNPSEEAHSRWGPAELRVASESRAQESYFWKAAGSLCMLYSQFIVLCTRASLGSGIL